MRLLLITLTALSLLAGPALANHTTGHPTLHNIMINVNGLVCDFCARALEKVFYKQDGVEKVEVNLSEHLVKIGVTNPETITDEQITGLVTDAGYSVTGIDRE